MNILHRVNVNEKSLSLLYLNTYSWSISQIASAVNSSTSFPSSRTRSHILRRNSLGNHVAYNVRNHCIVNTSGKGGSTPPPEKKKSITFLNAYYNLRVCLRPVFPTFSMKSSFSFYFFCCLCFQRLRISHYEWKLCYHQIPFVNGPCVGQGGAGGVAGGL